MKFYYLNIILIAIIFSLQINLGVAQEYPIIRDKKERKEVRLAETTKYLTLGFVLSTNSLLDERMSSLTQSGVGIGLYAGNKIYRKNKVKEYAMQVGYERLFSPYDMLSHQTWTQFNYSYLYQLQKCNDRIFALGPIGNILSNVRITPDLSNNSINWDLLGSLGIGAYLEQPIRRSGKLSAWIFFADAQIPVLHYVARPSYAISRPAWRDTFSTIGWTNRINTQVGLIIPVRKNNPNHYRISYQWTFLHNRDNESQKVVNGRHTLIFNFLINTI